MSLSFQDLCPPRLIMTVIVVLLSIVTGRTAAQTLPTATDAAGASTTKTSQMQRSSFRNSSRWETYPAVNR